MHTGAEVHSGRELFTLSLADHFHLLWSQILWCWRRKGSFASPWFLELLHFRLSYFYVSTSNKFANRSTSLSPSLSYHHVKCRWSIVDFGNWVLENESQELYYRIKKVGLDGVAKLWKASVKMYIFLQYYKDRVYLIDCRESRGASTGFLVNSVWFKNWYSCQKQCTAFISLELLQSFQ